MTETLATVVGPEVCPPKGLLMTTEAVPLPEHVAPDCCCCCDGIDIRVGMKNGCPRLPLDCPLPEGT